MEFLEGIFSIQPVFKFHKSESLVVSTLKGFHWNSDGDQFAISLTEVSNCVIVDCFGYTSFKGKRNTGEDTPSASLKSKGMFPMYKQVVAFRSSSVPLMTGLGASLRAEL
jgi:hypothetical protein